MTVSHVYYCSKKLINASVNFQDKKEKKIDYDVDDPDFKELMLGVALGSKATFHFQPSIDDILNFKGIKGEKDRKIAEEHLTDTEKNKISDIIIAAEKELPFQLRKV